MSSHIGALYTVTGPRLIGEMRSPEVAELLGRTTTIVLASGSVEQHGPHLPLLSDWFQGEDLIRRAVAELSRENVEVAGGFAIPFAPAEDAMSFAGTLSLTSETYTRLVREILESLHIHGFRRFPLIACHEQVMGPAMAAIRDFNSAHSDATAGLLIGWFQAGVSSVRESLCTGPHPDQDGHAGELETSRMLATRPELVDLSRAGVHYPTRLAPIPYAGHPLTGGGLYRPAHDFRDQGPDGYIGAAAEATAQKGERCIELAVRWICDVIKRDFI